MKSRIGLKFIITCVLGSLVGIYSGGASAEGIFSKLWDNTTFFGAFRADMAFKTTSSQNIYNQNGLPFQYVDVERQAYIPPDLLPGSKWGGVPLTVLPGLSIPGVLQASDTARRADYVPKDDVDISHSLLRFTGEADIRLSRDWGINARLRAVYDPMFYSGFNAAEVASLQGGIADGGGDRYADVGRVNFHEARGRHGRNINPLELSGRDYMVDLPTFILNYQRGNLDVRFGNQQIAWGQAIFFRTLDVANGLDLRRHLIIDRTIEEFEDERVPKLALRVSAQASQNVVVDGFVGKFQPDILPNPNTQYNVIPSQFYKPLDNYFVGDYDKKLDFGFRFKGDYGHYGWQAVAVSRYNPLGVFTWTESGINKGLTPWGGTIGAVVETAYALKLPCVGDQNPYDNSCRLYDSVGEALSHAPFTVGPAGIYSDREFFSSAGTIRMDPVEMINSAIADFPALRDVFASPVADLGEASALLNTFFIGSGGSLRGNVQRDYYRETVLGLGGSFVTETGNPESFWDQIILNLEVQYTADRRFTSNLRKEGLEADEYIITAVAEKWHRWSSTFPAAYLVAQYMHRSESDIVGLHLNGYGGNRGETDPRRPTGIANSNYFVFAGFQPWPNRKFIAEWAFLYDIRGGLLAQPLIKWNPGRGMSVDLFYNFIDGSLHGDGTKTVTGAIDYVDEIGLRFTYQL